MTTATKTNSDTAKAAEPKQKPTKRAVIPVRTTNGNGETRTEWIEAGPVWPTKDGKGEVLVLQAVPLQFLREGFPDELRITLYPVKDAE